MFPYDKECLCFRIVSDGDDGLLPEWEVADGDCRSAVQAGSPEGNPVRMDDVDLDLSNPPPDLDIGVLSSMVPATLQKVSVSGSGLDLEIDRLAARLRALPHSVEKTKEINLLRKLQDGLNTHDAQVSQLQWLLDTKIAKWLPCTSSDTSSQSAMAQPSRRVLRSPVSSKVRVLVTNPGLGHGPRRTKTGRWLVGSFSVCRSLSIMNQMSDYVGSYVSFLYFAC